jgi:hypothetical protein
MVSVGASVGRPTQIFPTKLTGSETRVGCGPAHATSSFRRVGNVPEAACENHETKNTTHTNTTSYQCPKPPQKWYLPPKYREIDNTGTHHHPHAPPVSVLLCGTVGGSRHGERPRGILNIQTLNELTYEKNITVHTAGRPGFNPGFAFGV